MHSSVIITRSGVVLLLSNEKESGKTQKELQRKVLFVVVVGRCDELFVYHASLSCFL